VFFCVDTSTAQADINFISNFGKQLHKNMKCLNLFMEMKLYLVRMSSNGLKDSEREMRTLKISKLLAAIMCPKSRNRYKSSLTGTQRPLN
jgi:hypothetical protein